ncbi:CDP-alcohol phosphatidyltransferase family protein [Gammaproteobacteria bacterium]|jgi:cardiolipin synthase|nr:CDP-alcohol phosphatidyltransferase family protein [Gammaproteobacteria bacterium]|tara:strand:- start:598 stop:1143 length:546 start_codon:yes stop_codon:yes gene_type:complete
MLSAIPNLITGMRFILVIPISIYIYQGNELWALILFIIAGLSDGLDGYLARKYNWSSEFGKFADPLADKCLIIATLLAFAFSGKLPIWFVYLMLSRDGIILIGAIMHLLLFENKQAPPNRWGKHYTGWTIALFIIVLLQSTLPFIPIYLEWIAMAGVIFFIFLSLFNYLNQEGRLIFKKIL